MEMRAVLELSYVVHIEIPTEVFAMTGLIPHNR